MLVEGLKGFRLVKGFKGLRFSLVKGLRLVLGFN